MFGDAIDTHLTTSNQGLAVSTAVRHASQFEQIAEFDELAAEFNAASLPFDRFDMNRG